MNARILCHRRRGIVSLIAIALIGLVGMAVTLLTLSFARDCRRTQMARDEAQARQLLTAALLTVQERADQWKDAPAPAEWTAPVPESLTPPEGGRVLADCNILPSTEAGRREVRVDVVFNRRAISRRVMMEPQDGKWRAMSLSDVE